jgi:hypothetical protein
MATTFDVIDAAARKLAVTTTLFGALAATGALPSVAAAQTPISLFPLPPQTFPRYLPTGT